VRIALAAISASRRSQPAEGKHSDNRRTGKGCCSSCDRSTVAERPGHRTHAGTNGAPRAATTLLERRAGAPAQEISSECQPQIATRNRSGRNPYARSRRNPHSGARWDEALRRIRECDVPGLDHLNVGHDAVGKAVPRGEVREGIQLSHHSLQRRELLAALWAALNVRLQRRQAKAGVAIDEKVEFLGK
jgi:hypothetical protein